MTNTMSQPHGAGTLTGNPMQRVKCAGTNRNGTSCGKWAIPGGTVCRFHGGSAPQVRRKAAQRVERAAAERFAEATLGELGVPVATFDGEALQELRDRYRGIVNALWLLAAELKLVPVEDVEAGLGTDGIYGRTYHQTGVATGEAKPNVVMVMLGEWSDRLAKVDEVCVRLGLEERRVRVSESVADAVLVIAERALTAAVPPEFHEGFKRAFAVEAESREITA